MYFNYIYYNNYKLPTIIVITKIQYLHDFCHGVKTDKRGHFRLPTEKDSEVDDFV